jgi:predicted ATPase/DNA-binding CsgD family transcriptional regulator
MTDPQSRHEPGRLIGRERELALVAERLIGSRLVTIAGLGGIGKTSLAREVTTRRETAGDRSFFVDLASVAEARGVAAAIATVTGAAEDPDSGLLHAIAASVAERPSLLVLDNFEHVLEARQEVGNLLAEVPSLRVMTTSRVPLGLSGEAEVTLGSLGLPTTTRDLEGSPAGALFLERAREHARLPPLSPEDGAAVIEICRRLDGLPLAIELAAAWSGVLTPRAILRRLVDERLDLSGQDLRHASLDAVVASTLLLVEPEDRAVFPILGVWAGAFDEVAARAVTGDARVLAALRSLTRIALVRVLPDDEGEPRFELLETIRAFARRRLTETDALTEVERRHAAHYAQRAAAAANVVRVSSFSDQRAGAALADPNILAAADRAVDFREPELAIRLAAALATRAMQTGTIRPTLERLESAMALSGGSPGVRSDGLNALVSLRAMLRQSAELGTLAAEAVALARVARDPIRIVRTLVTLGNWTAGDRIAAYREAAELAEASAYAWGAATAWSSLADAYWEAGQTDEAVAAMTRSAAASERNGDVTAVGLSFAVLGEYELNLGRTAEALDHLEHAAAILRAHPGLPFFVTEALTLLAGGQALADQNDAAYRTLAEATDRVEVAEARHELDDWLEAAAIVLEPRHPVAAARCIGALDRIRTETGSSRASQRLLDATASRISQAIGRRRLDEARAAGAAAERQALFVDLARIVRREAGPGAGFLRVPFGSLTRREREILARLADGRTDREIAEELGITAKTASVHVGNLKAKMGVATRVEAVLFARDRLGSEER